MGSPLSTLTITVGTVSNPGYLTWSAHFTGENMPSLAQPSPAGALSMVPLGGLASLCQVLNHMGLSPAAPPQPCLCSLPHPPASLPFKLHLGSRAGLVQAEAGDAGARAAETGASNGPTSLLHPPALSSHMAPNDISVHLTVILETVVWIFLCLSDKTDTLRKGPVHCCCWQNRCYRCQRD